jgi:hypothetical protein
MSVDPIESIFLSTITVIAVCIGVVIFSFLARFIIQSNVLCGSGGLQQFCCDEMRSSSLCFNPAKRCSWECGNYGGNFSGEINGCTCDCGDYLVSVCSGFAYKKI